MGKILSVQAVKKLKPGTDVLIVRDSTGEAGRLWIVKSGNKKLLKGILMEYEIKERRGWHYELPEQEKAREEG